MNHKCTVKKMKTGDFWKVQCKYCPLETYGVRFVSTWTVAVDLAIHHYESAGRVK